MPEPGLSYVNAVVYAPRERLYEVVDAVLYSWPSYLQPPALRNLNEIFEHAGSAYRVDDSGRQLVLRVDSTVEAAFRAAADLDKGQSAGEFLRRAWQHAYGLKPDPTAAYRDAVRAVEEAFVPVVSPSNTRATLGTVCRDLTNQQSKWELVLVDDRDVPVGIGRRTAVDPASDVSSEAVRYPGDMSELPIPEARDHLSEVAHEAAGGEVIYLTEGGQRLAAIVPADVAAAIEAAEDADDIRAAEAALAEPGEPVPAERLWAELGV